MSTGAAGQWVETPAETVGDALIASLAAGGIDHLFFTSGSEIGFFQEATAKARLKGANNQIRLITVPHEHASLNAALGFAAVSGRPAVTAAHVDCGTQHYGGAVHTAWRSGLPVIMTAGYPPTAYAGSMTGGRDEGGHLWMQETYDQHGIVRNYVKWDHKLAWQDNPGTVISRAVQVARSEPCGPVYLSFPKELALMKVDGARFPTADQLGIPRPVAPDPGAVAEIAERLLKAKHPVVIVSASGRNPESVAPLVRLAETLGLAVTESVGRSYMSFPFRHPLYQPQPTLKDADVVLVLETDVPWVPGRNCPADDCWVASVAHDPIKMRIPTYEFTADLRLASDPRLAVEAIAQAAERLVTDADRPRIAERTERHAAASKARIAAVEEEAEAQASSTPIEPLWVSYQVGRAIGEDTIVIDDTLPGNRLRDYLRCAKPGTYFGNMGSSGGFAPGAALGAKLAAPDKDVVAVTGDGFYMFGTPAPAIWAAAHHGAPFLTVVYTNRSYSTGVTRVAQAFGADGFAAQANFEGGYFDPPIDYAKEAEAAGGYGETVHDPADLAPALERGLAQTRAGKPAVISVWMKRLLQED